MQAEPKRSSGNLNDHFRHASAEDVTDVLVEDVYRLVCRTGLSSPGFCLLSLGGDASSEMLRRYMVSLKRQLQRFHQLQRRLDLVFVSAARFDQQTTTKLHRDGGPDECFLMLGYEPSEIRSEIVLADYSRCARDLNMTPTGFLEKHNPMFGPGADLLRPYATQLAHFSNEKAQVLLINNSSVALSDDGSTWQGVLHTATVHNPCDDKRRVVNSFMVASMPFGAAELVSQAEQDEFITTTIVRRRGYDRQHLTDDQ